MIAGVKQVCKALAAGQLRYVLLAVDADDHIKSKVLTAAKASSAEIRDFPSKVELGTMLNLDVPCAVAGEKI